MESEDKRRYFSGIWPLNEDATNYVHGNEQLSAKFGGSTSRSAQHSSGETSISASLVDSEAPSEVGFLRPGKGNVFTLLRAKAAAPERSLLIRSAAHDYLKTSTVVPAQHLQGILKEQQLAKKKRIDSSTLRAQLGNPGTRSGLYALEAVRKRCWEVEEAREEAKKAKRLAEERSAKKAEMAQREKSAFKDVVGKVTRGEL